MTFTIKSVVTESDKKITNKMREEGAYDWTRVRKPGEEDYAMAMPEVIRGLEQKMTRKEIAKDLCKREGQIKWIENRLCKIYAHPNKSKKEQALFNLRQAQWLMGRSPLMNINPDQFKSHHFKNLKDRLTEMEKHASISEGKNVKVAS